MYMLTSMLFLLEVENCCFGGLAAALINVKKMNFQLLYNRIESQINDLSIYKLSTHLWLYLLSPQSPPPLPLLVPSFLFSFFASLM